MPDAAELQRQVESLQQSIHRLQLEHDILKKANELLKKGLGVNPQLLSNREKTLGSMPNCMELDPQHRCVVRV